MSKIKHPYEKKQKSLKHDCRNTYGENDKSSRKAIAQGKARQHRAERRIGREQLYATYGLNDEQYYAMGFSSLLKSHQNRRSGFKKWADTPLGEVLKSRLLNK